MAFIDEDFLLHSKTAIRLFHDYASNLPIIDYHNHLPPQQISSNHQFQNITEAWLSGDHYKWRAMRTQGVKENFITGTASDEEKFSQWAATVPYTLRNPLYHWTHLELKRYFGIDRLLDSTSAKAIYSETSAQLNTPAFSVGGLLNKMKVEVLCTTDEPLDDLQHHDLIKKNNSPIKVLPAFRCDATVNISDPKAFLAFLKDLESKTQISISGFSQYLEALRKRHDYFSSKGCTIADIGLEQLYAEDYTAKELDDCMLLLIQGKSPPDLQSRKFKSAVLSSIAEWNAEKGWVQQYHLGAMRNNNTRMMAKLGANTGWDSIGDFAQAPALSKFLDRLDAKNRLAKTILYNLNPADNELMATMTGNFNDGETPGKLQWGSAWWFLDQKDGIEKQLNTLSNVSLLSRFVGMLTDSRSFLSFPRHEYFRRILCNLIGNEMDRGELPNDVDWTGKIIQDICYHNAKSYFGW